MCLVVHFTFMFQMIKDRIEPSSIKGIFAGYKKTPKAYKIYIPTQRNTTVCRDVNFNEDR